MTIKHWPQNEKPREKLLEKGANSLSNAELLAVVLRTGTRGKTVVDLARGLLNHFGGLQHLLDAPQHEICQLTGVGLAKYTSLQAVAELIRRYLFEPTQAQNVFTKSEQVKQFLLASLGKRTQEIFGCIFLNNKNQLLAFKELFYGSINRIEIYPREVMRAALSYNAVSVICVHNHPSGDANPSEVDIEVTKRLRSIFEFMDIRLLDHIIVAGNHTVSLAEEGFL